MTGPGPERLQPPEETASSEVEARVRYFDYYDDSFVTATFQGDMVHLKRDEDRPMWTNHGSDIEADWWEQLVKDGRFIPVDPTVSPMEAAKKY